MTIPLLFEDKFLLVIDKPAGVVVNRSETSGGETIQDWAEKKAKVNRLTGQQANRMLQPVSLSTFQPDNLVAFLQRSGIVHRLDKDTSGCLIIAKTPEAFVELQRQFKEREVEKEYLALVHGRVEPNEGTIRVPLARSRDDRQKFAVVPGGRMAETRYEVKKQFSVLSSQFSVTSQSVFSSSVSKTDKPKTDERQTENGKLKTDNRVEYFSLLRLFPKTGRTHQIRVHMKYFGHPIVSDDTYAGEDRARADRIWCPRMFLHAARLRFTHPETKKKVDISAPIPGNLQRVLTEFF